MPRVDTKMFYTKALELYGISPLALHWQNQERQFLRFEAICSLLKLQQTPTLSLIDAGCGFGDFYHYLILNHFKKVNYKGLDLLKEMVDIAKMINGDRFVQCDVLIDELPLGDYYVCSGALNTLTYDEAVSFITRCFKGSKKGFIFNFLEGAPKETGIYNYFSIDTIGSLGALLGARVEFVEGYIENDVTVGFYR